MLLQATTTKSNQREHLYNELLNRWLEEMNKQWVLHEESLATLRRRLSHGRRVRVVWDSSGQPLH